MLVIIRSVVQSLSALFLSLWLHKEFLRGDIILMRQQQQLKVRWRSSWEELQGGFFYPVDYKNDLVWQRCW